MDRTTRREVSAAAAAATRVRTCVTEAGAMWLAARLQAGGVVTRQRAVGHALNQVLAHQAPLCNNANSTSHVTHQRAVGHALNQVQTITALQSYDFEYRTWPV